MRNQTDEKHSFGAENSNAELPAKEGHCSDSLKFGANLMPLSAHQTVYKIFSRMQAYVAVETLDQKLQYFSKKTPGDCLLSSDFPTCCSNSLLSYHIKALIETIEELQQYFTSLIVQ